MVIYNEPEKEYIRSLFIRWFKNSIPKNSIRTIPWHNASYSINYFLLQYKWYLDPLCFSCLATFYCFYHIKILWSSHFLVRFLKVKMCVLWTYRSGHILCFWANVDYTTLGSVNSENCISFLKPFIFSVTMPFFIKCVFYWFARSILWGVLFALDWTWKKKIPR